MVVMIRLKKCLHRIGGTIRRQLHRWLVVAVDVIVVDGGGRGRDRIWKVAVDGLWVLTDKNFTAKVLLFVGKQWILLMLTVRMMIDDSDGVRLIRLRRWRRRQRQRMKWLQLNRLNFERSRRCGRWSAWGRRGQRLTGPSFRLRIMCWCGGWRLLESACFGHEIRMSVWLFAQIRPVCTQFDCVPDALVEQQAHLFTIRVGLGSGRVDCSNERNGTNLDWRWCGLPRSKDTDTGSKWTSGTKESGCRSRANSSSTALRSLAFVRALTGIQKQSHATVSRWWL